MPAPSVPFPPMEAQLVRELPADDGWQYEPKWDGFRGVFENVDGELHLWSRNERPLLRYFPELRPLGELLEPKSALDGEIVIARDGALDFDAMQTRLHPAESRIRKLSAEIPAEFVVFDVLLWGGEAVWKLPLAERRARVEQLKGFRISPATRDLASARGWLDRFEALGLDGVIGKRLDAAYMPGSREAVVKIKEHRTADCVVVGVRWKKGDRSAVATLLLGLYRDDGGLDYVGSCAVGARMQADVEQRVLPLLDESSDRRFSEPNRWGTGDLEETAVRPELVVEVRFDKVQGNRFRHGTKLVRWREDKDAADCTWRELRPPRDPKAPGIESLLA
ncbi:MAG TPA: ATP-dependent DNA ligase [Gaiellaceae bacterium]|nr:ATP-dependent DNA ligase [Gaiellaceae bacterium]